MFSWFEDVLLMSNNFCNRFPILSIATSLSLTCHHGGIVSTLVVHDLLFFALTEMQLPSRLISRANSLQKEALLLLEQVIPKVDVTMVSSAFVEM